jgi:hypothetical protein
MSGWCEFGLIAPTGLCRVGPLLERIRTDETFPVKAVGFRRFCVSSFSEILISFLVVNRASLRLGQQSSLERSNGAHMSVMLQQY